MQLLVDPIVYALPSPDTDPDVCARYTEHLALWFDEWEMQNHEFFVSKICAYALFDTCYYPFVENFEKIWMYAGEDRISYQDAYTVVERVLANLPFFEERAPGLQDIEIYEEDLKVRPDLVQRNVDAIQPAFREVLGRLAYAKAHIDSTLVDDMMLLTYPVTGYKMAEIEARAETNLETVDVDAEVELATDPRDLVVDLELADIWENTKLAIRWKFDDMVRKCELEPGLRLKKYRVAESFNASIKSKNIQNKSSVLNQVFRKCVLLLCGKYPPDGSTHHSLDKDHQRVVNGWSAWRMHITGRPLAYRLHYWCKGDEYILMQVAPFTNLSIEDPPDEI